MSSIGTCHTFLTKKKRLSEAYIRWSPITWLVTLSSLWEASPHSSRSAKFNTVSVKEQFAKWVGKRVSANRYRIQNQNTNRNRKNNRRHHWGTRRSETSQQRRSDQKTILYSQLVAWENPPSSSVCAREFPASVYVTGGSPKFGNGKLAIKRTRRMFKIKINNWQKTKETT